MEHYGQPPQAGEIANDIFASRLFHVPASGVFGSILPEHGLVLLPDLCADPRSLLEERRWAWPAGQVLLSALSSHSGQQGVLLLCFRSGHEVRLDEQHKANLLLCVALLSSYLTETDVSDTEAQKARNEATREKDDEEALINGEPTDISHSEPQEDSVLVAIEQERERIARDIHDGAVQRIASVLPRLEYIARLLEREKDGPTNTRWELVLREIDRACELLEEGLNELRHSISSLLPPQLEDLSFEAALRELLDDLAFHESGVEVFYDGDAPGLVPPELEVPVFRFVQEALNNARKHAHATRVSVRVRLLAGLLVVEVQDNGVGFDPQQAMGKVVPAATGAGMSAGIRMKEARTEGTVGMERTGLRFGLHEMRKRIKQVGGRCEVSSKPGVGTMVKAIFPVSRISIALTSREREVLRLLVEGLTNRAIAKTLSVSIETVKSHVRHIMQKMQVRDRTQAAVVATRLKLL